MGGRGEALRQSVERAAAASAELDSKLEADAVASICHYSACLAALLDTSTQVTQLVSGFGQLHLPAHASVNTPSKHSSLSWSVLLWD